MAVLKEKPQTSRKTVSILGSTGSVGCNTLDLIGRNPDAYKVVALTANGNVERLIEQARAFCPEIAVIGDESKYRELVDGLKNTGVQAAAGYDAIIDAADAASDWLMGAIVGAAGLKPTLAAVRRGAIVGLANKECLVCAGDLMMREVEKSNATLLPVDSEHNAIYQVFDFDRISSIEKIILTASGGPFRTKSSKEMATMTPEQAVAHPNWSMGAKISVDSATLMNKGLEMIEAYHLFPVGEERIDVVVHPQSVIHSLVAYVDGSVLAQLGSPDMRTPIGYALNWPERGETPSAKLDLAEIGQLTFEKPDTERFPALNMARKALQTGGSAPTILNAANEVAVYGFLDRAVGFLDIGRIVEETLERLPSGRLNSLDDVFEIDQQARRTAGEIMTQLK